MKDWQYCYELDFLKDMEKRWEHYNSFALSPFGKYKKNDIAKDLHTGNRIIDDDSAYVMRTTKVNTPITLYNDVVGGHKRPGDVVLSKLIINASNKDKVLEPFINEDTWIYVWAEDKETRKIIEDEGWMYICSKVTTFGEIYAIYFRYPNSLFMRDHFINNEIPAFDPIEKITLQRIGFIHQNYINEIKYILSDLDLKFTDHYSNYNSKHSWSALSLRGYYPDYKRIEKYEEMSKKYQEQHKDEERKLQDTELYKFFPVIRGILGYHFGRKSEIHRVRFMRLAPGGGELTRHTDQVDPDCGLSIGKLTRFHFPIQTNGNVLFRAWDLNGDMIQCNMKEGEFWVLDTRKPHSVINNGDTDRIHLVVDVKINEEVKGLLENA